LNDVKEQLTPDLTPETSKKLSPLPKDSPLKVTKRSTLRRLQRPSQAHSTVHSPERYKLEQEPAPSPKLQPQHPTKVRTMLTTNNLLHRFEQNQELKNKSGQTSVLNIQAAKQSARRLILQPSAMTSRFEWAAAPINPMAEFEQFLQQGHQSSVSLLQ
jgi:hypothetical protein